MKKLGLTRSLSSLCLGTPAGSPDTGSGLATSFSLARRRHSQIGMHSMGMHAYTGPSQSGQVRSDAGFVARHLIERSPCLPSPPVASPAASPLPGSRPLSAHPSIVTRTARIAEAKIFQLFALADGADAARLKGWKWLAEQTVVANRLVCDLQCQHDRTEPDADERDDLAYRLKMAQERLQFLAALGKRLQGATRGDGALGQGDTVWKLSRLGPARMPIEFLALLPSSATVIELAGNRITEVPDGVFDRFQQLRRLNLSGNQISTLHRHSLRGLEHVVELDLSNNAIAAIDPEALSMLGSLQKIRLDSNRLSILPRLPKKLEQANVASNVITAVAPGHLEGLSRLRYLNLNSNCLEAFRPPVTGLKSLEILCLGYNRLARLDGSLMRLVPNLRTLILADNRLSDITQASMQGPPGHASQLLNLTLAGNAIEHIERGAFSGHTALKLLDLEGNRLSSLQEIFPKTQMLMQINLSRNLLSAVGSDIFAGMPNLRKLDLSHNRIAAVAERILGETSHSTLLHIRLHDNELERFPASPSQWGWVRVDLYNNRFTPEEAARLDASNDRPGATGVLRLSNFPDHEREFNRWLGKPMTRQLGTLRYLTESDSLYEFLHTVRRMGSHQANLPISLREKRERILAAVLDRVETLLPVLNADRALASHCLQTLKSGLEGCGDRAMFAWWLMEIECRKHRILQASPDRLQLVQLGIWLHRLEKLLQFAKVLGARSTGNAAEAVEIQLWLVESLHHHLLGELGRPEETSMQILYKSSVLVHDKDLEDIQEQIAVAESGDGYAESLASYLLAQPFWQTYLAGDPAWQEAARNHADELAQIEVDYRMESLERMAHYDYDVAVPAYRAEQTGLDTQHAQNLAVTREKHACQMATPILESLQALALRARESGPKPDAADALARRHAAGWKWLDDRIAQARAEWQGCQVNLDSGATQRAGRLGAHSLADKLRGRLQRWESRRASLRVLHELGTLPHPHNLSFDFSGLGLTEFPSALLGLLPEQTYFIKLSENAIDVIPEDAFSRFSRLEYLHLARNRLAAVGGGSLRGLRCVRILDLSDNLLTRIAPTALRDLVALEECDARQNALTELPWLPRGIRSAMFDRNRIAHVGPEALRGLHQLAQLRLQQNAIDTLELPAGGLPALTDLNVGENRLTILDMPLHRMPKLVSLDLSRNHLVRILPAAFDRPAGQDLALRKLNVAGNRLQHIEPHLFNQLRNLSHLELQENCLTALPYGCVSGMPALRHLNLSDNRITALESGVFAALPNLMTLDLSCNRIKAIADAAFHATGQALAVSAPELRIGLCHNQLAQLPDTIQWPASQLLVDLRYNLFSESVVDEILSRRRGNVQLLLQNPRLETESS